MGFIQVTSGFKLFSRLEVVPKESFTSIHSTSKSWKSGLWLVWPNVQIKSNPKVAPKVDTEVFA